MLLDKEINNLTWIKCRHGQWKKAYSPKLNNINKATDLKDLIDLKAIR